MSRILIALFVGSFAAVGIAQTPPQPAVPAPTTATKDAKAKQGMVESATADKGYTQRAADQALQGPAGLRTGREGMPDEVGLDCRDPLAVVTQHQAKGVVAVFEIDVRLACRDAESHAPAKNAAAVVRVRLQHLSRAPAWVRTCFVAAKAGNFVQRKARGARRIRDT